MAPDTKLALNLARLGYLISLVLIPIAILPGSDYSVAFLIMLLVPLLLPGPGVLKGQPYTHAWSGFIACLYLLWAATALWVNDAGRLLAGLSLCSLLVWLIASTFYARLRGRELGLGLRKQKDN